MYINLQNHSALDPKVLLPKKPNLNKLCTYFQPKQKKRKKLAQILHNPLKKNQIKTNPLAKNKDLHSKKTVGQRWLVVAKGGKGVEKMCGGLREKRCGCFGD